MCSINHDGQRTRQDSTGYLATHEKEADAADEEEFSHGSHSYILITEEALIPFKGAMGLISVLDNCRLRQRVFTCSIVVKSGGKHHSVLIQGVSLFFHFLNILEHLLSLVGVYFLIDVQFGEVWRYLAGRHVHPHGGLLFAHFIPKIKFS